VKSTAHLHPPDPPLLTFSLLGVNNPRHNPSARAHNRASSQPAPHNKSVQFDFDTSDTSSPKARRHRRHRSDHEFSDDSYDSENSPDERRHHRSRGSRHHDHDEPRSPSPAHSDATIDLPPRFDKNGRPKTQRGEDPIADKIEDFLAGKGSAGKLFRNLTDGLLGGGGGGGGGDDGKRRR